MRRAGRLLIFTALLVGAGVFVWQETQPPAPAPGIQSGAGRGGESRGGRRAGRRGGREDGPVSVLTAPVRTEDVPVTLEAVGTAQALNTVTVRAQVDGRLIELAFREGQDVRKGDILARIDPTLYQAQYDQAVAKKAQDEANLANARLDLQRYVSLAASNAGSRQQADTQRAAVAQLEAQLKADQGAIDNARAYLDYTVIRAPIDGRLGIRFVDAGNLVRASDATGIVTITQLRPLAVLFNLPQQNLRAVNAAAAAGPVPIEALESDNRTAVDRGRLEVVDNQVDAATGTVRLKAVFPNADLQLWPGAFVNVRLTVETLRDATVVPTASVQRGPNGAFVYVVGGDRVALRQVAVSRQTETLTVVASGLAPGERVVTTGFARLTDGDRVTVADPEPDTRSPDPASAAPPARPPGEASSTPPRERGGQEGGKPPPARAPVRRVGEAGGGESRPARPGQVRDGAGGADPATLGGSRPAGPAGTGSARP